MDATGFLLSSPLMRLTGVKRRPILVSMTENEVHERLVQWGFTPKRARWARESAEWSRTGRYARGGVLVTCTYADMHTAAFRVQRRLRTGRATRARRGR